jgi:hypothetical protein
MGVVAGLIGEPKYAGEHSSSLQFDAIAAARAVHGGL